MIDRRTFFDRIRRPLFGGRISAAQTGGLNALLDAWEQDGRWSDLRWLAYALATAHHETARTMRPIRERGGADYLRRQYDVTGDRPALARRNRNTEPGDGVRYAGRGYVQLTWKTNYLRAGRELDIDLAGAPDRALEPDIAARILFSGMAEGWFTGRRLADYFNAGRTDWRDARRIVNALDKADVIAGYARAYHGALLAAAGQPSAARTAAQSASAANAQGPRATNSTPVRARGATAGRSAA
jgi:putative chitinase